ncbi:hypothetical protein FE257_007072 [Aspergillus nanangensis]|uniref:Alpha and gamma adaptin binding protein p34 family protein n=1 Tax=Aspergillus nanangensis TaxID=2582783 RepID=A0AAD4GUI9_ASPNN|nr:hypothetical protein FE257_007072 [Aspergillus nanangensis]
MSPTTKTSSATVIQNPRRLLILSPTSHSQTVIPHLLQSLTGSAVVSPPTQASGSETPSTTYAGYTSHPPLPIENKYYKTKVPIWVDSIPLESEVTSNKSSEPTAETTATTATQDSSAAKEDASNITPQQWKAEFSGSDALCVREAIGAMIMCVRNFDTAPSPESTVESISSQKEVLGLKDWLKAVGSVRELVEEERGGLEVPGVVVLVGRGGEKQQSVAPGDDGSHDDDYGVSAAAMDEEKPFSVAWWEDQLCDMGLLGVEGLRRVREVLETHDWTPAFGGDDDEEYEAMLNGLKEGGEDNTFGGEVAQVEREMMGLRFALERGGDGYTENADDDYDVGDDDDVEQIESLMLRLKAMRDMSDGLPENDRKRFAAQTIRDLMKEMEL